jgi:serine phosphatase RsbU (regulator of sigma subunit)/anti-sigma regulatory factor (Ser/Thr protein kinase)
MGPIYRFTVRVVFPCQLAEVRPAVLQVRTFLVQQGVDEAEAASCELALAEACNNAVQYAAGAGREESVVVEALVDAEEIELRVEDHTMGFDLPLAAAGVPDPECESGRGLFLMRSLMEEVIYLRALTGNTLVLRRRRVNPSTGLEASLESTVELQRRRLEDERIIRDMAEELSSCYESLSAIFRYGAEQASHVSIRDFADRLLRDLLRITGAGWYVLRVVEDGEGQLGVFSASEADLLLEPLPIPVEEETPLAVECRAVHSRRDAWFDGGSPLATGDPLAGVGQGAVGLVHPVFFGETLIGTLAVGGRSSEFGLTAARTNVVHTFGDFLAIQIVNSRYQEERVSNLLVARELEIARHIQRSLLVKLLPEMPGVELAGYCESASQVGGDFFDVVQVSEKGMLVLISDVMGKGIPAAMFAVILRSLVRASLPLATRPAALLAQVNRLLYEELNNVEMFITAQLAYVDLASRQLVVANAGHCPMLIAGSAGSDPVCVAPEGIPLGVLANPEFEQEIVPLEGDMWALLYTDGLTESGNPEGEQFGQRRLARWLAASSRSGRSVGQMKQELLRRLSAFRGEHALPDDQTFMIMALHADPGCELGSR